MLDPIRRLLPRGLRRSPTAFVIFGQGRTGSTLLQSLLDSHPDVLCEGEILSDPVDDPITTVLSHRAATTVAAYGFKVKIYQLTDAQRVEPHQFLVTLVEAGFAVVYIHRTNLLRHAISNSFAELRGHYHDRSEGHRPQLTVDPTAIIGVMERRQGHLDREAKALDGIPHLTVTYETDLLPAERHQAAADRIFHTLGLPTAPVTTELARSVPGALPDRIANYDQLAEALAGTVYEPFLTDPAYG